MLLMVIILIDLVLVHSCIVLFYFSVTSDGHAKPYYLVKTDVGKQSAWRISQHYSAPWGCLKIKTEQCYGKIFLFVGGCLAFIFWVMTIYDVLMIIWERFGLI